jgi:hypothetical protein
MERRTAVLSIFLTFSLLMVLPAQAQHGQHSGQQEKPGMMARSDRTSGPMMGMMQGEMMQRMRGMHQQMMQNPMHRSSMMAFMLPALADTLGLSDQQRSQLQELKSEAMSRRQEQRQQMMKDRKEFMGLFEEGSPAPDEVRRHLTAMAEKRAGSRASLYETAQEMNQVLTEEQRQTLEGMTHRQRMRQMMSSMPMMDMMKMMRSMHGSMMGDTMQKGSMMQEGQDGGTSMQHNPQNQ